MWTRDGFYTADDFGSRRDFDMVYVNFYSLALEAGWSVYQLFCLVFASQSKLNISVSSLIGGR